MSKLILTDTDVKYLSTIANLDSIIYYPNLKSFFAIDNEGTLCVRVKPEKAEEMDVNDIVYLVNIRQITNTLKRYLSKKKDVPNTVSLEIKKSRLIFHDDESNVTYRFMLGNESLIKEFIDFVSNYENWITNFDSLVEFDFTSDRRKEIMYALSSYKDGNLAIEVKDGKLYIVIFSATDSQEEREYFFEMEIPTVKLIKEEDIFVKVDSRVLKYLYDIEYEVSILNSKSGKGRIIKFEKNNLTYISVEMVY